MNEVSFSFICVFFSVHFSSPFPQQFAPSISSLPILPVLFTAPMHFSLERTPTATYLPVVFVISMIGNDGGCDWCSCEALSFLPFSLLQLRNPRH